MNALLGDHRLHSVLAALSEAVLIVGDDDRILLANPPAADLFGYGDGELAGRTLEDLIPAARRAEHVRRRADYGARCCPVDGTLKVRGVRKDGSGLPLQLCLSALDGTLTVASIRDDTDRQRTREALRHSEERFRLLVEQAPDGIFLCNVHGRIVDVNPAGCEMLQYSRDQLRRMHVTDLVLAEDAARMATEVSTCARGGVARCEWRLVRFDRSTFVGEVVCRGLPDGRLQAIVRDITERRRVEQELRDSEARFRAVFEQAASGIALLAPDGRWLRVNRALCQFLGHSEAELLRLSLDETGHPDDLANLRRRTGRLLAGEIDHCTMDARLRGRDGEPVPLRLGISLVPHADGSPQHFIVLAEDRRAARQTEQTLRELRAGIQELLELHVATETAQAIAHDINQPLNAVTAYAEAAVRLLQAGHPDPERLLHVVNAGAEQAERAGRVVRELLQFLQKGETPMEAVNLNELVDAAVAVVESNGYGGFEAEMDLEPGLRTVRANRLQIQKVLVNLLRNSVEAMREAGVATKAIHIRVRTVAESGMAHVTVTDTGPGLDAQVARRIFEPFYTTKARGIGMGLAICRSLVRANGGRLWLDTDARPGATFHFTLPLTS